MMDAKEAVKLAEYWQGIARQEWSSTDRDSEALAVLTALAEENAALMYRLRDMDRGRDAETERFARVAKERDALKAAIRASIVRESHLESDLAKAEAEL
jgi:septal ring factor EnvC (AmiA/AmiB activator)